LWCWQHLSYFSCRRRRREIQSKKNRSSIQRVLCSGCSTCQRAMIRRIELARESYHNSARSLTCCRRWRH
jgi:hypothetical protein